MSVMQDVAIFTNRKEKKTAGSSTNDKCVQNAAF